MSAKPRVMEEGLVAAIEAHLNEKDIKWKDSGKWILNKEGYLDSDGRYVKDKNGKRKRRLMIVWRRHFTGEDIGLVLDVWRDRLKARKKCRGEITQGTYLSMESPGRIMPNWVEIKFVRGGAR